MEMMLVDTTYKTTRWFGTSWKVEKIRLGSLFSGIGAFEKALTRLKVPFELAFYCEIDKYASCAYSAIHAVPESLNLWDIAEVDLYKLPDVDMLTYGFPCTDISIAGGQGGIKIACIECGSKFSLKDLDSLVKCPRCKSWYLKPETRSGLLFYALRIARVKKPTYLIAENVKNLVGKFRADFERFIKELEDMGYNNYIPINSKGKYTCINAKDFGVPQNRERIFVVSILKEKDDGKFTFPVGFDSGLRLKDILESEVDEKYYISDELSRKLLEELNLKSGKSPLNSEKEVVLYDPYNRTVPKDQMRTTTLRTNYSNGNSQIIEVRPCLTPDRLNKRQLGRRFKEDGEPAFTVNTQDRHGVLIREGNLVIKEDGISSCLDANYYKGINNHGARTAILEHNKEVVTRKDPATINQIGMLDMKGNDQTRRVYDTEGLSPTLTSMQGGNRQPKVVVALTEARTEEAKRLRREHMKKEGRDYSPRRAKKVVPRTDGMSNCITTGMTREHFLLEKEYTPINTTLANNVVIRIRRLTPLECFRLMGFDDEDYFKAREALINKFYKGRDRSNSQMYKMAGNSIVVDCLEYIFYNLLSETGDKREVAFNIEPEVDNELKYVGGIESNKWLDDGKDLSRNYSQGYRVYDSDGVARTQTARGGGIGGFTGLYIERKKHD